MATSVKVKVKEERKAWVYENGEKKEFEYTPSGRLSKFGEFRRRHPNGIIDVHNLRAVLR